jgi:hypothetical protein
MPPPHPQKYAFFLMMLSYGKCKMQGQKTAHRVLLVEWRNQFKKMYNIDQEFLFPKVSKLWKSALTKKAFSKWFLIYTHKFLDILQQINLSLMYSLCFSTQHPNSDYRVFFNVFCGLSR